MLAGKGGALAFSSQAVTFSWAPGARGGGRGSGPAAPG